MAAINGVPAYSYFFANTAQGPTTIKTGSGMLRQVSIGLTGASWQVQLQDGSSGPTMIIAGPGPAQFMNLDMEFVNGLVMTTTGTPGNVSISYT
jgi:hypothetical protein